MKNSLTLGWMSFAVLALCALSGCSEEDGTTTPTAGVTATPPPVATPPTAGMDATPAPQAPAPQTPAPQTPAPQTPAPQTPAPQPTPPAAPPATFAEVLEVFSGEGNPDNQFGSCAFMSCHDSQAPQAALDLVTDPYNAIVNVMALGAPNLTLVVPGDPDASYLYQKIVQDMPAAGGRMPPGGGELPADRVEVIRSWIAAGAQM